MKERRLGRGLSGLINRTDKKSDQDEANPVRKPLASSDNGPNALATTSSVPVDASTRSPTAEVTSDAPAGTALVASIRPNPYQPRLEMRGDELEELQASIKEHGILQPLLVRKTGDSYELVAGERRLRAAIALGLSSVPVVVRATTESEMQTLALVENIQRVDLNAVEKAKALRAMMTTMDVTQKEVAKRVGKARSTIANLLRLLELPGEVLQSVSSGGLTEGHARALLRVKGKKRQIALAERVIHEGLSVRAVERLAEEGGGRATSKDQNADRLSGDDASEGPDIYLNDVRDRIERALNTKASIKRSGLGGVIQVRYHDASDLDRLLEHWGA